MEEHWSARLSVHIWDRLDLSRRGMEKLRHLLSFLYDAVTDKYSPFAVWESVRNHATVWAPRLVSRQKREAEFNTIAAGAEIEVDAHGNCQRDTVKVTVSMYQKFSRSMRAAYTTHRPARPVLYLDATGASLGKGWTHVEIGSADFVGECRQSRATMGPLAGETLPIPPALITSSLP